MKVVILCGGMGTRLREETERRPKPMVEVGNRPILWHIMKGYARHGFNEFVLALGYKGDVVKDYFLNYQAMNSDFTVKLGRTPEVVAHTNHMEDGWTVTLADTGREAMTGARVKRIERYVAGDRELMVTYGDGVADVDLKKLHAFHKAHGKIGTVTGVRPSSRFGELQTRDNAVVKFAEKPQVSDAGRINGGFFVFKREFFNYLGSDDSCVLEKEPLEQLAEDGELMVYPHDGFWQCMDTYRDWQLLEKLWASGAAPWKTWKD